MTMFHRDSWVNRLGLSALALPLMFTMSVTANADSENGPMTNTSGVAVQDMLRNAILGVDDFSQNPSHSWSTSVTGSSVEPTLTF